MNVHETGDVKSDLSLYRESPRERDRIADLMSLVPAGLTSALDVGARDGFLSRLLAQRISHVTALDLTEPTFRFDRVTCVAGDVTDLQFADSSFDLVFCAEVLEHVSDVEKAASELTRVARRFVLVGVPYRQDIRVGRLTCYTCGERNPPWGHVNSFDDHRLLALFPRCAPRETSLVGFARARTNPISVALLDLAGNPFGDYAQDEPCIRCGRKLVAPPTRNFMQKVASKVGLHLQRLTTALARPHGNWIHVLFEKA